MKYIWRALYLSSIMGIFIGFILTNTFWNIYDPQ